MKHEKRNDVRIKKDLPLHRLQLFDLTPQQPPTHKAPTKRSRAAFLETVAANTTSWQLPDTTELMPTFLLLRESKVQGGLRLRWSAGPIFAA